jgi:hypothetical protein
VSSEKRGCFKVGCFGCLGTAGVVVLIFLVLLGLGLATGGGESRMEPIDRSQDVPPVEPPKLPPMVLGDPDEEQPLPTIDHEIDVDEPGRIVLDLHKGSFEVRPGPPGSQLRLEGRYDEGKYELEESYSTYGERGWTYKVSFDQRGFGIRPIFQDNDNENRVRLIIPRDMPVVLEGMVGIGESNLELGGLWLLEIDLDVGIGEHSLSFNEPLPVPMRKMRLDTSVGVIDVDELGNASPRETRIKHSIGETRIDLRGAWRRDAEVEISCGIGECDVRAPREAKLDLAHVGVAIGESGGPRRREPPAADAPTVKLSVSGSIGEVRVR